ncbi:hypothetical protein THIOM_001155, partial [Candidatus Thiomargarita nelsonii]
MKKNLEPERIEEAIKALRDEKIRVTPGHIVNFPGETLDDVTTSIEFFQKLNREYGVNGASLPGLLEIYPGTEVERIAIENGLLHNFRWTRYRGIEHNLLVGASPDVPLYENIPTERIVKYCIREAVRLEWYEALRPWIA